MRRTALAAALAALAAAPGGAAPIIMLIPKTGPAETCYDLDRSPNPKWIESASARADKAFAEYLAIARVKGSLKKLFVEKQNWALDEQRMDAVDAIDPWADRVQRTERTSLIVANVGKWWFRGVWNAYDSEGRLLGRYDAEFQGGRGSAFFEHLHLFSPNSTSKSWPLTAFCRFPGDIQIHQAELAEREAKKAAKRASRQ